MITRKIRIIAAWKQKPPALVHFVFRSEEISTFFDPTSRFGVGLMAETEPFTTTDLLFLKPSHENPSLDHSVDYQWRKLFADGKRAPHDLVEMREFLSQLLNVTENFTKRIEPNDWPYPASGLQPVP